MKGSPLLKKGRQRPSSNFHSGGGHFAFLAHGGVGGSGSAGMDLSTCSMGATSSHDGLCQGDIRQLNNGVPG